MAIYNSREKLLQELTGIHCGWVPGC